jgi:hypothetical protein
MSVASTGMLVAAGLEPFWMFVLLICNIYDWFVGFGD